MGQKFCSNCGDRTEPVTVDALSLQVAALTARIAELTEARKGAEQRFLEVDTAEKVVARVMNWTKYFLFFAGIPLAIIVLGIGVWAGRSFKDFHDVVATGKSSVETAIAKARLDAKAAENQASTALDTSKQVNQDIQGTQQKLASLSASVKSSSENVGKIDASVGQQESKLAALTAATTAQGKVVETLSQKFLDINKAHVVADISSVHPEFGIHRVLAMNGEVLNVSTKPPNTIYVAVDTFIKDLQNPSLKVGDIADALKALEDHGFRTFFGQVAVFTGGGRTNMPLGSFTSDACSRHGGIKNIDNTFGAPCVLYFKDSMRPKALEAAQLLSKIEPIPQDRIKLILAASLDAQTKELLDNSGLDMAIVLGP